MYIKPCPWCGVTPKVEFDDTAKSFPAILMCRTFFCDFAELHIGVDEEDVIQAWNDSVDEWEAENDT